MLPKFDNLIKLLTEDPDSLIKDGRSEIYYNSDAVTFGIVKNTILYQEGDDDNYSTHAGILSTLLRKVYDGVSKKETTFNMNSLDPVLHIGKSEYMLSDIEKIVSMADSGRSFFKASGRLWANSNVISFWTTQEKINKTHWSLIFKLLKNYNLNPLNVDYQFAGMLKDKLMSYDDIFSNKSELKSSITDKKLAELQAKGHLIGGKWGAALRKL
jgi:hypothetical protein